MSDQNSNRPTPNFDLANKQTQEKEAVQEPLTEIAMEDIATEEDIMWMRHALTLADKAESIGEVPVGACVVLNGELIGEGFNTPITDNDPSAHAELRAVKEAAAAISFPTIAALGERKADKPTYAQNSKTIVGTLGTATPPYGDGTLDEQNAELNLYGTNYGRGGSSFLFIKENPFFTASL